MMTEPDQAKETTEAVDLDARYRAASSQKRGDWGSLSCVIVDDEEDDEDAGR